MLNTGTSIYLILEKANTARASLSLLINLHKRGKNAKKAWG